MRVLHLLGTGRPGGVETFVLQLARASRENGAQSDVCIIGEGGPVADLLEKSGASVTVLDTSRSGKAIASARLISLLRAGSYDVVHAHSGGRIPRLIASRRGAKVISHLHGVDAEWIEHATARDGFFRRRISELGFGADEVAVSSQYMESLVNEAGSTKPVVRLSYGVDTSRFLPANAEAKAEAKTRLGLGGSSTVIGFVGRLVPQKGLPHVLALASSLTGEPGVTVVVVGDGPLRKDLEERIHTMRLSNVTLADATLNVHEIMRAFDTTIVTSNWEPFGIVGLESMSMGIPVVAFDVGGLSEVVVDGVTGFLAPGGDIHSMRSSVSRLLDDSGLRTSLGEAGRSRVLEHFDTQKTSAAVFAHYTDLMNSPN